MYRENTTIHRAIYGRSSELFKSSGTSMETGVDVCPASACCSCLCNNTSFVFFSQCIMQHPFLTQTKRRVNPCSRARDSIRSLEIREPGVFIKLIFLLRLHGGFCSIRENEWDRRRNTLVRMKRKKESGKKVELDFLV